MKPPIYLDNHATTRPDPRVIQVMLHHMEHTVANPSSSEHLLGREAEEVVEEGRRKIAQLINAASEEVHFTSGATESIWLAIHGFVQGLLRTRGQNDTIRIALLAVEHHAVIDACKRAESLYRVQVASIGVDRQAHPDVDAVRQVCSEGIDLLCVMAANNEVGTLYDVPSIARIVREAGGFVFSDSTQAIGKVPVDFSTIGADAVALSGHKFHGPKGVGALVLSSAFPFQAPFAHADGRRGARPGTPNVPGIAGIGTAAEIAQKGLQENATSVTGLRDQLEHFLLKNVPGLVVNGGTPRLPHNLHASIPDIPAQALVARVRDRLAISTGAACRSGVPGASHVLRAMGLPEDVQNGAFRVGLSKFTTEEDIAVAGEILAEAIRETRSVMVDA